jgi:iron-sulfur cluster assembly protein
MLTLTDNASTIVKEISDQIPDAAGLRITSESADQPSFEVEPAAAAEPGDAVVEQDGATIYLDEASSQQLDDKILDAQVDQSGGVQFGLAPQQG